MTRYLDPVLMFRLSAFVAVVLSAVAPASAQVFKEVAESAGLQNAFNGNGVAVADYDLDGDLDLYVVSYQRFVAGDPRTWNHMYRNNGDRTFSDVTDASGLRVETIPTLPIRSMGNKQGASWGDYDNDGDPDLILTNVGPEFLFQNQGDGTFEEVSAAAGIQIDHAESDTVETATPLWWDWDTDGDLDLYISSWNRKNRFYDNNGDGTFTDISIGSGIDDRDRSWMALPADYNSDGRTDLYVINDFTVTGDDGNTVLGINHMYLANGDGSFREVTEEYNVGHPGNGMGATLGDFNHDGLFDIFLTNIATLINTPNPFYQATAVPPYNEIGFDLGVHATDWGWGAEFLDADNDGDLDLYVVNGFFPYEDNTPNRLFSNTLIQQGAAGYVDVSVSAGVDGREDGHGLVTFDYDNDGDLDMVVGNWSGSTEPVYLYENISPSKNWLKVKLVGTVSNRDGFGAVVEITTTSGPQYRIHDGADFLGQSVQPLHFGLGTSQVVDKMKVTWPNGYTEEFFDIAPNQTIEIVEGSGITVHTESVLPLSSELEVSVYPSPVTGTPTFSFNGMTSEESVLTVHDVMGRLILTDMIPAGSASYKASEINAGQVSAGLYLYRLQTSNGREQHTGHFILIR